MPIIRNNKNYGTVVKLMGEGPDPVLEHIDIIENGDYTPQEGTDGWNSIHVDVPTPEPILKSTTFTSNGTYHPEEGTDGWNEVTVQVSGPAPVSEGQFWIQNDADYEQTITIEHSVVKGFQTSEDNEVWSEPTGIVANHSFNISAGQKLYIKIDQIENDYGIFSVSGPVSIGGNLSTLFNKLSVDCYQHIILGEWNVDISNVVVDSCTIEGQYAYAFGAMPHPIGFPQFNCKVVTRRAFDSMFGGSDITEIPTGAFSNIQSCDVAAFQYMFSNTQITSVPVDLIRHINATNVDAPFANMFAESQLSSIPEGFLDGASGQLQGIFNGCRELKTVPAGLFNNLKGAVSLRWAFAGSGLETVPEDLIENIHPSSQIFNETFLDCRSLRNAPRLPRNEDWGDAAYVRMFCGCSSLEEAPEIWAKWKSNTDNWVLFESMFEGCTSLTKAAKMHWNGPLRSNTFRNMYSYCYNLQEAWADFTEIDDDVEWFGWDSSRQEGTLHVIAGTSSMYSDKPAVVPTNWTITEDYSPEYFPKTYNVLIFTNLDPRDYDNVLTINYRNDEHIEYQMSTDGSNWEPLVFDGPESREIPIGRIGSTLYIRSETGFGSNGHDWESWRTPQFNCILDYKLGGRIVKLDKCELSDAFRDDRHLMDSSELVIDPALVRSWDISKMYALQGLFAGCSRMEHAMTIPDIPCGDQFYHPFEGCKRLQELRVEVSNATQWMTEIANSVPEHQSFTLYKKFGSGVRSHDWMTVEYI